MAGLYYGPQAFKWKTEATERGRSLIKTIVASFVPTLH